MLTKLKVKSSIMSSVLSVLWFLYLFLVLKCKCENIEKENTDNNPYEFHIGGVLSSNASESYFKQTIEVMYSIIYLINITKKIWFQNRLLYNFIFYNNFELLF